MLALMSNYDEKVSATAESYNALGSAEEENARYLNSVEASINKVISAFSELSKETLSSDFVKFILASVEGFIKMAQVIKVVNVVAGVALLTLNHFGKLPKVFTAMTASVLKTASSFMTLNATTTALLTSLTVISPLLALFAGQLIIQGIKDLNVTFEEQKVIVQDLTDEIIGLENAYKELSEKANRTDVENAKLAVLEKQIQAQKTLLELEKQKEFEKAVGQVTTGYKKEQDMFGNLKSTEETFKQFEIKLQDKKFKIYFDLADLESAEKKIESLSERISNGEEGLDEAYAKQEEIYAGLLRDYSEAYTILTDYQKAGMDTSAYDEFINSFGEMAQSSDILGDSLQETEQDLFSLTDVMTELENSTKLLTDAWKEQANDGQLSIDTIMKIISAGEEYLGLLMKENGVYKLNEEVAVSLFNKKKDISIEDIKIKKQQLEIDIKAMETTLLMYKNNAVVAEKTSKQGIDSIVLFGSVAHAIITGLGETGVATQNAVDKATAIAMESARKIAESSGGLNLLQKNIDESKIKLQQYDLALDALSSVTLPSYTGATKKASDATSGLKDKLQEAKDELSETEKAYKAMQNAIINQLEKEISLLEDKLKLTAEQKKLYEAQQQVAVSIIDSEIQAIKDKISALDKEKKAQDNLLAIEKAQFDIQKAKDEYERAKRQKVSIYREGKGFVYESDPKAMEDAQNNLDEALQKLEDLRKKQEEELIKDRFQDQIDALERLKEAWSKNMDDIFDETKNHADVLKFMEEFENASLEERERMLADFTSKYKTDIIDQNKDTQSQIDKLISLKDQWSKSMDIQDDLNKYAGAIDWLKKFEDASYEERVVMLDEFTKSWVSYYEKQTAVVEELTEALREMERASRASAQASRDEAQANKELANSKPKPPSSGGGGTGSNPSLGKYAKGGVDDFGTQGITDFTGKMAPNIQVDGSKEKPEVILNNEQAGNLLKRNGSGNTNAEMLYRMANTQLAPTINNKDDTTSSFVIQDAQIVLPSVKDPTGFAEALTAECRNIAIQKISNRK